MIGISKIVIHAKSLHLLKEKTTLNHMKGKSVTFVGAGFAIAVWIGKIP